ncbi:SMI1/KNR4 family protein [Corallococcus exiguus]|uniref:SMI1/KNR4 family protein n=1 Tax=Corallococcus exiguus TaxID=83462 RepID=UPI001471405C|nr:SMI1/KNR4 family protein [Corallococcus exiguus]NNB89927.1 SMI1/KNR4 family protein [Corallococcus exiguus]NNC01919.1 SMI1/KNR4 family protein [Corallococcus exiguus]NRD60835.1 SMI1/KNR4 family protein [Corallococcus exiguus]
MSMDSLLKEFSRLHFPRPPATPADVAAFEARVGWKLDADLRAFYLHADGGTLFEEEPDASYRIVSLAEIRRARVAIMGRDTDEYGAPSQYTLVDMQDTNYVILDVAQHAGGSYPLFDAWHETYPVAKRIASSFAEFLERAMRSDGFSYWLGE